MSTISTQSKHAESKPVPPEPLTPELQKEMSTVTTQSEHAESKPAPAIPLPPELQDVKESRDFASNPKTEEEMLKDLLPEGIEWVAKYREGQAKDVIKILKEKKNTFFADQVVGITSREQSNVIDDLTISRLKCRSLIPLWEKYFADFPNTAAAYKEVDSLLTEIIDLYENARIVPGPGEVLLSKGAELLTGFLTRRAERPRVITVNDVIVSYEHLYKRLEYIKNPTTTAEAIEQKLREVLTVNPNADLNILADDLGIKIRSVQRKGDDGYPPYDLPIGKT